LSLAKVKVFALFFTEKFKTSLDYFDLLKSYKYGYKYNYGYNYGYRDQEEIDGKESIFKKFKEKLLH
jgi:hypothetical protein